MNSAGTDGPQRSGPRGSVVIRLKSKVAARPLDIRQPTPDPACTQSIEPAVTGSTVVPT